MDTFLTVLSSLQLWFVVIFGFMCLSATNQHRKASENKSNWIVVRRFFLSVIGICCLIALANYLVNPQEIYPTRFVSGITLQTRQNKLTRWDELTSVPEIVILGSSRGLNMSPGYIKEKYLKSAFNASFAAGTPRDYFAFAKYLTEQNTVPKIFIVGLGIEQFSPGIGISADPLDKLAKYIDYTPQEILQQTRFLLDFDHTQRTVKSLVYHLFNKVNKPNGFDSDGYVAFGSRDANINLALGRNIGNAPANSKQIQLFQDFLQLCYQYNIQVILYLVPYQPELLSFLENSPEYRRAKSSLLKTFEGWQQQYTFSLYDLTDVEKIGGNGKMFLDSIHLSDKAQELIIDFIFQSDPTLKNNNAF